jgi:hypothetical protein
MEVYTPIGQMNFHIPYSKEEFINKCKTDEEFSEKWGLKIEERELSLDERVNLLNIKGRENGMDIVWSKDIEFARLIGTLEQSEIPTKIINVTYRPKCKLEYVDLKITILPSGKTFENE